VTNAPGATDPLGTRALRIVRGDATAEELAALVTVLVARPAAPAAAAPVSRWAGRAAGLRAPLRPGPGAWRASGLPR
jgi:hypothetical protein